MFDGSEIMAIVVSASDVFELHVLLAELRDETVQVFFLNSGFFLKNCQKI
jgi:hypothetical protein